MEKFINLYFQIDQTSSTNEKIDYMAHYFKTTPSEDAAWALFFLLGKRIKRLISSNDLKKWCMEYLNMTLWLYEECYSAVGDTAETVALLVNTNAKMSLDLPLSKILSNKILPLQNLGEEEKKITIFHLWKNLDFKSCYIFNKLLTGGFRVGASKQLTLRALSLALEVPQEKLAQALIVNQEPTLSFYENLRQLKNTEALAHQPLPFYLASPIEKDLSHLGDPSQWVAEWKWDGIRAQLIHHEDDVYIWSRSHEIITEQCPEITQEAKKCTTSFILDGELLAYKEERALPFFALQKRLGRKKPSKKIQEEIPLIFMAYDLLSKDGIDRRGDSFQNRRKLLEETIHEIHSEKFLISPLLSFQSWDELKTLQTSAKELKAEGVMLKEKSSIYKTGRVKGFWWKYKIDPMTIDAVLLYAQPGSGRRANLYTDYTFAVWDQGQLVPIAKAYSGLDQKEIEELDRWIRRHTTEKFGPVRQLEPFHVFEIAFESAQPSSRHKSAVALRFPRILRWRKDKTVQEADQLEDVKKFIIYE